MQSKKSAEDPVAACNHDLDDWQPTSPTEVFVTLFFLLMLILTPLVKLSQAAITGPVVQSIPRELYHPIGQFY